MFSLSFLFCAVRSGTLTDVYTDCGSSLFSESKAMPGITIIKAGTLDGGAADISIAAALFTKDRRRFATPVEGAQQITTANSVGQNEET
jgi:hypothetical protein